MVGAGARILGPIRVGKGAIIGANAGVVFDGFGLDINTASNII